MTRGTVVVFLAVLFAFSPVAVDARGYGGGHSSGSHSYRSSGSSHSSQSGGSRYSSGHHSSTHSWSGSHHSGSGHSYTSKSHSSGSHRSSHGKYKRDPEQRRAFMKTHPCPSTGKTSGACPGYVVDHVHALKHGGRDDPSNMQWQTTSAAKAKDKWE